MLSAPPPSPTVPPPFYDVDGDGHIVPLDALLIINHLNDQANGEGEAQDALSLVALEMAKVESLNALLVAEKSAPLSISLRAASTLDEPHSPSSSKLVDAPVLIGEDNNTPRHINRRSRDRFWRDYEDDLLEGVLLGFGEAEGETWSGGDNEGRRLSAHRPPS